MELQPGSVVVDGTLGGAGHSRRISEQIGETGHLIAMDRDELAIQRAEVLLSGTPTTLIHGNFCDLPEYLPQLEVTHVDAILLDLGLSSDQLADDTRGFSFDANGPLDLRFDTTRGEPASRLVQRLTAEHLADLIYEFGEERYSRRIARAIVGARRTTPITTAEDLASIVRRAIPHNKRDRIDPATRTFQALRIAVNDELRSLENALRRMPDCLSDGGRLAIISFHSLEDRRVKEAFRDDARLEV
ncbi:MAG TPA: 16S rRNA (cytosine(1402)-N(4))-methyltransferase RsmH, partial [Planctomycetaceae bacterium]|nr:16S rRNA (cytosine(1402)-N(4))-methyltransferase RsmH [Planctomycetaceae bacterium]